ncbi:hypothetical protein VTK26DRAFT_4376 [Humicola hyalothermophila]
MEIRQCVPVKPEQVMERGVVEIWIALRAPRYIFSPNPGLFKVERLESLRAPDVRAKLSREPVPLNRTITNKPAPETATFPPLFAQRRASLSSTTYACRAVSDHQPHPETKLPGFASPHNKPILPLMIYLCRRISSALHCVFAAETNHRPSHPNLSFLPIKPSTPILPA